MAVRRSALKRPLVVRSTLLVERQRRWDERFTRGEGKPDALVLFGSRFQKTPAGQPPELAIDARMKVCAHDGR